MKGESHAPGGRCEAIELLASLPRDTHKVGSLEGQCRGGQSVLNRFACSRVIGVRKGGNPMKMPPRAGQRLW